jgi:hypothetical protein
MTVSEQKGVITTTNGTEIKEEKVKHKKDSRSSVSRIRILSLSVCVCVCVCVNFCVNEYDEFQ